jgi:hypothetical protein
MTNVASPFANVRDSKGDRDDMSKRGLELGEPPTIFVARGRRGPRSG